MADRLPAGCQAAPPFVTLYTERSIFLIYVAFCFLSPAFATTGMADKSRPTTTDSPRTIHRLLPATTASSMTVIHKKKLAPA